MNTYKENYKGQTKKEIDLLISKVKIFNEKGISEMITSKEEYLKNLISDYERRINKYLKIIIKELPDSENILDEEERILKNIDPKSYKILLDISGKKINSVELSNLIDKTFISYPKITFIIGGSNGVTDKVRSLVNYRLSCFIFCYNLSGW